MATVIAKYRAIVSDNYQGASGKPYEDKVAFEIDENAEIYVIFGRVANEIEARTAKVAELTMCVSDKNYQIISVEVVE